MNSLEQQIQSIIQNAQKIVVIQADNPDGDSLASALALEHILADLGKEPHLYCGVSIPDYLKYHEGWDRVSQTMPTQFDASIIVDTSAITLLEKIEHSEYRHWVASKPVIVLDHHAEVECDIPYATIALNDKNAVATGEVIYRLAQQCGWQLNLSAKEHIVSSILSDSLGLSSEGTTPSAYRIIADLVEQGVDRAALEESRRALSKMPEQIYRYKAQLIDRTELWTDQTIATVTVTQEEIKTYSPLYNPSAIIHNDMLQIEQVLIAIVFKVYDGGRVTAAIKTNTGGTIADKIAQHFGGGGHPYASGFKVQDGRQFTDIKAECIDVATSLLQSITHEKADYETV